MTNSTRRNDQETKTFYAGMVEMIVNGVDIEKFPIDIRENENEVDVEWVIDVYKRYLNGVEGADAFLDVCMVDDVYNTPGNRIVVPFNKIDVLSVNVMEVEVDKYTPGKKTPNW